jgi:glutamate synthase (NADPH/NADH) large chain
MIKSINEQKRAGLSDEEAIMSAFQANAVQDKKITKQAVMQ